MGAGDTSGAIAASLSGIPIIEKGYKVGAAVAKGAKDLIGSGGVRSAVNALGRRFGAGEQVAESFDAGVQHGSGYVQANPVQTGVKQGGKYAGGLIPDPRLISGVGTIGVDGYNKMLANIKGGIDPTKPAPAAPSVAPAATPAPTPLISAVSPAQSPSQPAQQPAAAPGKVAAPAPKPMELSNGVDNGSGLQITNGFEAPAPAVPSTAVAAPAGQQPAQPQPAQQPQKFAKGKVPALIDGVVRGPGGPTEDKVPAKVSPKEAILPAATVAALGGPEAIAALIKATNNGQAPESEVEEGGEYAVGYNGMYDTPNIYKQSNDELADVGNYINRGDPVKDVVRGLGDNIRGVGRFFANSADKARQPNTWDDSGARLSDVPASSPAASAPQNRPSAPTATSPAQSPALTSAPEYGNEGRGNPAALISSIGKPQAPGKPLMGAALPIPSADTQVGTQGPQMGNSPDGYRDSMQQIANIKALSAGENKPERNNLGGTNWEADERQRRRDFDNFSARSDLNRALYDATRSGRPQAIQAAGGALTHFNAQADGQANKAGEFDNGMRALAAKSEQEREMEGVKGKNQLAAESVRGSNLLAAEGMRGQNSLLQEALRGKNQLSVADRQAESLQASREYMNPLDAQIKQGQLKDSQLRAQLRDRLLTASPEDQAVIARQIAAMDGKYQDRDGAEVTKARMSLVGDLLKAYNGPAGVPLGPDKQPIPFEQFAAPAMAAALGQQQGAPAAPSFEQYAQQIRARNKGQQLSDKQLQDAYTQRYGQ